MSDKRETPSDPPLEVASSPCAMQEFEAYDNATLVRLLNELIEGERAGAVGLLDMKRRPECADLSPLLQQVAEDEAHFCAMLTHHVEALGGEPSRRTGVFAEKLARREGLDAKLLLLDKGQSAVVKMLDDMLDRIDDGPLRRDLTDMRDVHVVNIARCAEHLD